MRGSDGYAALVELGRPVVTTADASMLWGIGISATTRSLTRLAEAGLVGHLRHGIWKVGPGRADARDVLPVLTMPYPSYVSFWSALFQRQMIEQIPRMVYAATLERTKRVKTTDGEFSFHHLHPDLFGGEEGQTGTRAGVATAEKALFDTVYLLAARSGRASIPEIELPDSFNTAVLWYWSERIPSVRLRSMVTGRLKVLVSPSAA